MVLAGKIVAITGAGRGLGAAYARLAAVSGAKVMVNDIDGEAAEDVARQIRDTGGAAHVDSSDISSWEGANALISNCRETFGGIDGLCNNAALFSMASVLEETPERLNQIIAVNLLGTAYVGMAAARQMVAQKRGGAIVNITSGAQSGSEAMFSYAASKGGVSSLTYSWAIDLAPHGIRVNAISPHAQTRQALSLSPDLHKGKPPETVAPLAVYLLSELSQKFNGQVFFLSGGELALVSHPAIAVPVLERPRWTIEALADAVDRAFSRRQMPVGRSRQEIKVLMQSDSFDVK
jgi:NAD(P)-dependent dehydrogenase (short-subunit alcohol dehydrogenase family)